MAVLGGPPFCLPRKEVDMWVVEAVGEDSEGTFTYLVDAPQDATPMAVACCAYAKHGQLHAVGLVPELLGPIHQAFWQEVTQYEEVA